MSRRSLFRGPLVSVTDQTCSSPRSSCGPVRFANATHLVFVRSGVFVRHDAASPNRCVTGDTAHVLFFNEGEPFRVSHPTGRGDVSTALAFAPEVLHQLAGNDTRHVNDAKPKFFRATHAVVQPSVSIRLNRLRRCAESAADAADSLALEEEALGLLETVLSGGVQQTDRRTRRAESGQRRRREIVERVKIALAKAPSAPASLADLAVYTELSPFHLARTFRDEVGLPIHQYLIRLRLAEALQRMADSRVELATLALDLGFSSPSHFTMAFRRVFGIAPSECRRLMRRGGRLGPRA